MKKCKNICNLFAELVRICAKSAYRLTDWLYFILGIKIELWGYKGNRYCQENRVAAELSGNRRVIIVFFVMGIKPGPKPIAKSTGKPDKRRRDNKKTPGNTSSLKPHIHKKGD